MWDDAPVINAFASAAPAGVRDHAHLPEYIHRVILRDGERRPEPAAQAMADMAVRPLGFVYDRATGLVVAGGWADHERCASALMHFYELTPQALHDLEHAVFTGALYDPPAAERYIDRGLGFLANSPQLTQASGRWPLQVGSQVVLTAQEKLWFKALQLCRPE